jgi:hypothetical protein
MTFRVIRIGADHSLAKEADAFESIMPGHIIDLRAADSKAIKANLNTSRFRVAVENDIFGAQGQNSYGRDDPYQANDRVIYYIPTRGSEVECLVGAAVAAIQYGSSLSVNPAIPGTLMPTGAAGAGAVPIAHARQSVDNSAGGAPVRILVEVI